MLMIFSTRSRSIIHNPTPRFIKHHEKWLAQNIPLFLPISTLNWLLSFALYMSIAQRFTSGFMHHEESQYDIFLAANAN